MKFLLNARGKVMKVLSKIALLIASYSVSLSISAHSGHSEINRFSHGIDHQLWLLVPAVVGVFLVARRLYR